MDRQTENSTNTKRNIVPALVKEMLVTYGSGISLSVFALMKTVVFKVLSTILAMLAD